MIVVLLLIFFFFFLMLYCCDAVLDSNMEPFLTPKTKCYILAFCFL